jgi:hypothetical protein
MDLDIVPATQNFRPISVMDQSQQCLSVPMITLETGPWSEWDPAFNVMPLADGDAAVEVTMRGADAKPQVLIDRHTHLACGATVGSIVADAMQNAAATTEFAIAARAAAALSFSEDPLMQLAFFGAAPETQDHEQQQRLHQQHRMNLPEQQRPATTAAAGNADEHQAASLGRPSDQPRQQKQPVALALVAGETEELQFVMLGEDGTLAEQMQADDGAEHHNQERQQQEQQEQEQLRVLATQQHQAVAANNAHAPMPAAPCGTWLAERYKKCCADDGRLHVKTMGKCM